MKEIDSRFSDQVTLVIENYGKIAYFSIAWKVVSYNEISRLLKSRKNADEEFEPMAFTSENLNPLKIISFNQRYPFDVITVDVNDTVLNAWTEPTSYSRDDFQEKVDRQWRIILCPEGLIPKANVMIGISNLTLKSSMSYAPIYYQEVWLKQLKSKSDQEIIDIYNSITGRGYRGYSGTVQMSTLGQEIHSRPFDSSIIISLNQYGSISSVNYSKKVLLVNNRLEFVSEEPDKTSINPLES